MVKSADKSDDQGQIGWLCHTDNGARHFVWFASDPDELEWLRKRYVRFDPLFVRPETQPIPQKWAESQPRRALLSTDSYCPSCGHNRDASAVSSIDNDDGTHYCQKCSAEWVEDRYLTAPVSAIQPIHAAGDDGWTDWQKPTMRGYKMQCCDCGLVHETEFRIFKVEESPSPDEHYGHVVSPDDYRLQFRMKRGSGHQAPMKLWLWRNFVDGDPQYWAFESPFPTFENGDPITLGSPAGYAIVKPCADGRNGRTDESVIEEIKRVLAKTPLSTTQPISKEK